MRQHRKHYRNVGVTLATALLLAPALACGPTIFADTSALTIVGEPPPPPPPPEPEPEPEPPPKPKRVEVTAAAIVINDKILFEVDKAVIRPESFDLMNEITQVVKDNPRIKKISIEGHTDDDGSNKYNKKLSQKRADSVMTYLVEHGIEAERLQAAGFGEDVPLVPNDSDANKEKNRRVEFLIIEQDEVKNVVEIDPETGKERVVETKATPATKAGPPAKAAPEGATVAAPEAAKKEGPK
ncbi:OmpA domain protein [Enhygromyxa salina]|uniref:OmpA domain protein n=1 Tax=Enhygromyxa salina TaxID=215803 RepID=A0A0C1ZL24_9BACT|nr:OmpA family protein [Enhygromyxa salina]KIG18224.1 OmpA domain protein [Enhygromyxa salina]